MPKVQERPPDWLTDEESAIREAVGCGGDEGGGTNQSKLGRWFAQGERKKLLVVGLVLLITIPTAFVGFFPFVQWAVGPTYSLTIRNGGYLAITDGELMGDGKFRPVGRIGPSGEEVFTFRRTGTNHAIYLLKLRREDGSVVVCNIGRLPDDWSISLGSHDRLLVPDDTCQMVYTDSQGLVPTF